MTWFETLTGINERSPNHVRSELSVQADCLLCPNGKLIAFGSLETPTLGELRSRVAKAKPRKGTLRLTQAIGDVRHFHCHTDNANALFQVASQFNLLEMTSPWVTPEDGVGIYEHDHTQGPACAIACGAGTIYRNYFAPVGDQIGQSKNHQIDCVSLLAGLLEHFDFYCAI